MAFSNAGELRRRLRDEGITWTVNAALADGDPLPRYGLGADLTQVAPAATVGRVDVPAAVAARPATNTLLAADLADRAGAPPQSVDWRNRYGTPWITEIRDQDGSEHCWIYGATALVEAMVRIEHCVWCPRSEGDFIEANGIPRTQGGNPQTVLTWVQNNGIADLDCVPWADRDPADRSTPYWTADPPPTQPWTPSRNRSGRTVRIPLDQTLGNVDDQKAWIANVGPIVACFEVFDDFYAWSGNTPYVKSSDPNNHDVGGHCVLIVGYDDNLGCWIIKNSWGTGWGDGGFGLIAYGQCDIDYYVKQGLQGTNPDPWTKRRNHNGSMIESGDGALHRNFELIAPSANGTLTHWWRDNSAPALPWNKAEVLAGDSNAAAPTLTATTYNRNFEFVYPTTGGQIRHWYFDQASAKWNEGEAFGSAPAGPAGFVESGYGPGNFEVVYCNAAAQLQHWWRDASFAWHQGVAFGSGILAAGPSLLQSTWGNLELVAVLSSGRLQHWWRHDGGDWAWVGDQVFGSGVASPPVMIQGQYGMANEYGHGNFELCVAMPDGTVQHWWRDNTTTFQWSHGATFGAGVQSVIALVEGSFGFNLELIVIRVDGNLQHYWRDGAGWHAGAVIGPTR